MGLAGTLAMDVWARVLSLMGQPKPNWAMPGRWLGHVFRGRMFHDDIGAAQPVAGELGLGWALHYGVGVLYGVVFVLLAGPGVTGEEVLLLQTRVMLGETGVGESFLDTQEELQSQLFDLMKDGADRELIEAKVGELIDLQSPGAAGEVREGLFDQNMAMIDRPWFYHFLTYDPRPMLRKLEQPVLAVNGSKDLQVLTSQNLDEIRRVFEEEGKDNFKAIEFEGLNHLFQPATTGAMSEYGQIETTFDENAMQVISDWILKQLD